MRFDPRHDYVVARMLPNMQLRHEDMLSATREFTTAEARELYMDGLPLLINHRDGEVNEETREREPLLRAGTVLASSVRGADAMVLGRIEPELSPEATFASNAVAKSIYGSVSLGNLLSTRIRATTGTTYLVKTPEEVSLCRLGRRGGSTITAFCPGRATIERLARYEPEALERMIDAHGYRAAVIDACVTADDDERYISALVEASRQRFDATVAQERLFPRPPPEAPTSTMSDAKTVAQEAVKASDNEVAAVMREVNADAAPSATVPLIGTAAGEASRGTESIVPSDPQLAKTKAALDAAVQSEQEKLELKRLLAAALEEKEKSNAALQTIKDKEMAKKREMFDNAIKSVIQHHQEAQEKEEDTVKQVETLKMIYDADATKGIEAAEQTIRLAQKAAANMREIPEATQRQVLAAAKAVDDEYVRNQTARLLDLRQQSQSIALQSATPPSQALSAEPLTDRASIRAAVAAEKTRFERRFEQPSIETAVGQKRDAPEPAQAPAKVQKRYAEVPRFSIKASGEHESFDAAGVFAQQLTGMGYVPSYDQLAMGVQQTATGRNKASADGRMVPEMALRPTRSRKAYINAANFNPPQDRLWNEALTHARFSKRGAAAHHLMSTGMMQVDLGRTEQLMD